MKKHLLCVMALLIVLTTACSNKTKIELPENFVVIEEEQLSEIPNKSALDNLLDETLQQIGVKEISYKAYGESYNPDNEIAYMMEAFIVTDTDKQLLINLICMMRNEKWDVMDIKDVQNNKYYYVMPGASATSDIYDYETGDLVSKKSMTHEEFQEKIKKDQEEADKKFKEDLERLVEQYTN